MEINLSDKVAVKNAIDDGIPCYYRCGFQFKGAGAQLISKEKALELLPHYSPGMGFYELKLEHGPQVHGTESLVFNEYSEADML